MTRGSRRLSTPLRFAVAAVATLAVCYGAAILWLVSQETRLVFQAGRPLAESRPAFPYTEVDDSAR